jgi:hypothetical protein
MKNSKFYHEGNKSKGNKIEIWSEDVNGSTDYWMKKDGISYPLTERQYNNRLKKVK